MQRSNRSSLPWHVQLQTYLENQGTLSNRTTLETKKVCQSADDIISNLPRDAIDNILTSLPLRDAARTCILSQKWRYMWANTPYLVFDRETFTGTTKETEDKVVIAIQQALLHKLVPIVKFVLSLPGLKSSSHIHLLVAFLTRNSGLQELTLHLWEGDRQYKLPSLLFLCQELARLSLQDCVIEPPTPFKGFKKLVSLELYQCLILPDVLSSLISTCVLLEEVKMSSPIPVEGDIEISAPNLRKLSFTGDFPLIRVKDAPLLSSCVMCLLGGVVDTVKVTSVFFKSLCNLPAIQDLQLDFYYAGDESVDSDNVPRELPTSLNHLRSLTLWKVSFGLLHEVSTILCLIRSSPNLVKIVVDSYGSKVDDEDIIIKLLQVQEWQDIYFSRLREVVFNRIFGTTPELQFIELLLTISPKLETMILTPHPKVELKESFEILTKVTLFRRSSPIAKLVYRN